MANPEHVQIVKSGAKAVNAWVASNRCRGDMLDLTEANLEGVQVVGGDLRSANLTRANCQNANFSKSVFSPDFVHSPLEKTGLPKVATVEAADFTGADLSFSNFSKAKMKDVKLCHARLPWVDFTEAEFGGTDFKLAQCAFTTFVNCDFSGARNLDSVRHGNRSSIGIDTLQKSSGLIPPEFLQGCGLSKWEIQFARLYDPALSSVAIENMVYEAFDERTEGPFVLGGTFISYSWKDTKFVDKLYSRLQKIGAPVYLDRHTMVAGDIEKQVFDAIRLNDIVLLVLSKDSIESDWVESELEAARKKEKAEKRDVLCPVALDASWKEKVDENVLWRQLKKKLVLDFSSWKSKAFDSQFEKLTKGMKLNYPPSRTNR